MAHSATVSSSAEPGLPFGANEKARRMAGLFNVGKIPWAASLT